MIRNKPQLTISLLVSDRLDTIQRCLDSLRPIMKNISCELILTDTSKNPKVRELLLKYTDQVYEFEWCRDFAKARNLGLEKARGEWFMFLDDDEWFVETDTLIDFFCSGEYKQYGYANYQVRNFFDVKFENYSDCWVTRMGRIDKDTKFVGKVHEILEPLRGERKDLYALVHHSGYIHTTKEEEKARFERNVPLLLEMIEEDPYNMRWQTQLIQEYYDSCEWESLEAYSRDRLKFTEKIDIPHINLHIATFYAGLVYALHYQKKYIESIDICEQALADLRASETLKALMHLKKGENYLRLEKWNEALKETEIYFNSLEKTNQSSTGFLEESHVLLSGTAFEASNQRIAYSIYICSHLELGNTKALHQYYDKLGWGQSIIRIIEDVEKYFVKAMWTLSYEPIFVQIIVDAFKNRNLRELFCKEILSREEQQLNAFQEVLYTFADAMQRVSAGPQSGDMLGYYEVLQYYVQATCQWYDFLQEQNAVGLLGEENPSYIQAALFISDYLETEGQDVVQALGYLKSAVELIPDFASGIGSYLHFYGELEKQRADKHKREMEALRVQVIGQVNALLESGQIEAATQIIGQLKQMFPEDLDVAALALDIRLKNQ